MLSKENAKIIKSVMCEKLVGLAYNLDCYSVDFLNTIPKKGYEENFYYTKNEIEKLSFAKKAFEEENEL